MAKHRVVNSIARTKVITPTLRNKLVPLEYKRMLISNIVIPSASYGSEIFGMSEKRTIGIKKVVDIAISQILNSKNYSRIRAYKELDVKPIFTITAISRARAFAKWVHSTNIIGILIATSEDFKTSKYTWCKGSSIWLKKFKIDINNPKKNTKEDVLDNYMSRIVKRDKTLMAKLANDYT